MMKTLKTLKSINKENYIEDNLKTTLTATESAEYYARQIMTRNQIIEQASQEAQVRNHEISRLNQDKALLLELADFTVENWFKQVEFLKNEISLRDEKIAELEQRIFLLGGSTGGPVSHTIIDSSSSETTESCPNELPEELEEFISLDDLLKPAGQDTDYDIGDNEADVFEADTDENFLNDQFQLDEDDEAACQEQPCADSFNLPASAESNKTVKKDDSSEKDSNAINLETDPADTQEKKKAKHTPPKTRIRSAALEEQLKNLLQDEVIYDLEDKTCPVCGSDLVLIGVNLVRHELYVEKPKLRYRSIYRAVYECKNCSGRKVPVGEFEIKLEKKNGNKKKGSGKTKNRSQDGISIRRVSDKKKGESIKEVDKQTNKDKPIAKTAGKDTLKTDGHSVPASEQDFAAAADYFTDDLKPVLKEQNKSPIQKQTNTEPMSDTTSETDNLCAEKGSDDPECEQKEQDAAGLEDNRESHPLVPAVIYEKEEDQQVSVSAEKDLNQLVPEPGTHKIKAPIPNNIIWGSNLASISLISQIMVMKFVFCVPFASLEKYYSDLGYDLKRNKMSSWAIYISEHYFEPLTWYWHHKVLLEQHHNQYDETYYTVHNETYSADTKDGKKKGDKKPNTSNSYFWGAVSAEYEEKSVCILHYRDNRRMENAQELYGEFKGAFIVDKYSGYNYLIEELGLPYGRCWNHWYKAIKDALVEHDLAKSHPVIVEAYKKVGKILAIDDEICRLPYEQRYVARVNRQAQLVYDLFDWCEGWLTGAEAVKLPDNVRKALNYGYSDPEGFFYFLTDPNMPMHNLNIERQFRTPAKQRRISFFCDSPAGARALGNVYSVINTSELGGIPASRYIPVLLQEMIALNLPDWHSASDSVKEKYFDALDSLSPWSPWMRNRCLERGCDTGDEEVRKIIEYLELTDHRQR